MNVLNSRICQNVHQKRQKKSNFIFSDFGILLVCCLGRVYLHKNPRNICVAICFRFTKKIFILTRLEGRTKVYILNGLDHMIKMATMAINSKNLCQNQKAYDFEMWLEP